MRFLSSHWFFLFVHFDENDIACDFVCYKLWKPLGAVTWYLPCYARWVSKCDYSVEIWKDDKFVHFNCEFSKNCGTEKSIEISLRMRLSSRFNLGNSRSLSEVSNVSASAIIGVINTIVLPRPYVNMRERIVFETYRYHSCRQCFDLHDRAISDERGICMPAIGKVCSIHIMTFTSWPEYRWHTT